MGAKARSALIVASDTYDDPAFGQLRAPSADAGALARVLGDQHIGGFEVTTVVNRPAHEVNLIVEDFFADRTTDDLLLVHFSCHGVKDENGDLYFAMTDTRMGRLGATAVSADFVNSRMARSRSRRVVLLLDCCYAGAFERGMVHRANPGVDIESRFGGRGRAVVTASNAVEYAFEGEVLTDVTDVSPSIFTSALVTGLETGDADRNQDGWVALDELYDYVYDKVRATTPHQTPGKWTFGVEGELVIARRGRPVTTPSPLPDELREAIVSSLPSVRTVAVHELGRLLTGTHAGLSLAARIALQQLVDDDSRTVAIAAAGALEDMPVDTPGVTSVPATLPASPHPPVPPPGPPVAAEPAHPVEEAPHPGERKPVEEAKPSARYTRTKPKTRLKTHESGSLRRADPRVSLPGGTQLPSWAVVATVAVAVLGIIITVSVVWLQGGDGPPSAPPHGPTSQLPKNKMIVVQKDPKDPVERSDLMIVNANSSAQQETILLKDGMRPTISPDRRHVLFTRKPTPDSAYSVLWIADVDGNNPHPFVKDDSGKCRYVQGRPAWSYSGKLVAMSCMENPDSAFPTIFIYRDNGTLDNTIGVGGTLTGFMTWTHTNGQDGIVYVQQYQGVKRGHVATDNPWLALWWLKSIHGPGHAIEISRNWRLGSYDLPDWSDQGLLLQRKDSPDDDWGHLSIWDLNVDHKPHEFEGQTFQGASFSPNSKKLVFYWMMIKPAHEYIQYLSVARLDDLDKRKNWTDLGNEPSSGQPPAGKAQPAWGTL